MDRCGGRLRFDTKGRVPHSRNRAGRILAVRLAESRGVGLTGSPFVGQLKREGKAVSIRERGLETVQLRAIGADARAAR